MFGAIYGDVIGSYYEIHCTKEYDFPFVNESTFTDDSVLIAAVCKTILNNPSNISKFEISKRSKEYAAQYRQFYSYFPNAGFGNMFAKWAKSHNSKNNRSYANGAAMRVIPIGYAYSTIDQVLFQAKASALPTHNHREAIKAAQSVAAAVFLAKNGASKEEIRNFIERKFKYDLSVSLEAIRDTYVFDSRASYSVPPAIIAFLESHDYENAVRSAISLGGDAATQACIAGGIAEAFYGEIPDNIKRFCNFKIDSSIRNTAKEFCKLYDIRINN